MYFMTLCIAYVEQQALCRRASLDNPQASQGKDGLFRKNEKGRSKFSYSRESRSAVLL
jgi:hypothetical protein